MEIPKLCVCGNPIKFSNEDCCENCFSLRADRLHGRSQRIKHYPWLKGTHEDNQTHARASNSR